MLVFIILMTEILGLVCYLRQKKVSTSQWLHVPSSSCETGKGG